MLNNQIKYSYRIFVCLVLSSVFILMTSCQKTSTTTSELDLGQFATGSESASSVRAILSDEHLADPPSGISNSVTRYESLDSSYITYSENPVTISWYDPVSVDLEYESFELYAYLPDESRHLSYLRIDWTASDDSIRVVDPFTGDIRDPSTYELVSSRTSISPPGPNHYKFTDLSYDTISSEAGGKIKITAGYPDGQL